MHWKDDDEKIPPGEEPSRGIGRVPFGRDDDLVEDWERRHPEEDSPEEGDYSPDYNDSQDDHNL